VVFGQDARLLVAGVIHPVDDLSPENEQLALGAPVPS
jgi:hypothetical protein